MELLPLCWATIEAVVLVGGRLECKNCVEIMQQTAQSLSKRQFWVRDKKLWGSSLGEDGGQKKARLGNQAREHPPNNYEITKTRALAAKRLELQLSVYRCFAWAGEKSRRLFVVGIVRWRSCTLQRPDCLLLRSILEMSEAVAIVPITVDSTVWICVCVPKLLQHRPENVGGAMAFGALEA